MTALAALCRAPDPAAAGPRNLSPPHGLKGQVLEAVMTRIGNLLGGAICAVLLGACAGGVTPYENLNGRQVRGLPKEAPMPPQPDAAGPEMPS